MTGYEAFSLYHGIKLHITTDSYDFFKYHGKTNVSVDSFEKRKDKYHFYKLSRKYSNQDEYIIFLVANFLHNEKTWVGGLLQEEAEIVFRERQRVRQSLTYIFENECRTLFDEVENPNQILTTNGDYPLLMKKCLRKDVSIETVCLLNSILNFVPNWTRKIQDDLRWPVFRRNILKYTNFLQTDDVKYKCILKKVMMK